jgi:hypothetical protein
MSSTSLLRSEYENEDSFWNACVNRFLSEGWINVDSLEMQTPFSVKTMEKWSSSSSEELEDSVWNVIFEPLLSLSREHRTGMCLLYARFAVFSKVYEHVGIPFLISPSTLDNVNVFFSHFSHFDGFWLKKRRDSLNSDKKTLYKKDNKKKKIKDGKGKIVNSPWNLIKLVTKESCKRALACEEMERYRTRAYKKTRSQQQLPLAGEFSQYDALIARYEKKRIIKEKELFDTKEASSSSKCAYLSSDRIKKLWKKTYIYDNGKGISGLKAKEKDSRLFASLVSPIDVGDSFVRLFSTSSDDEDGNAMGESLKKTCLLFASPPTTITKE